MPLKQPKAPNKALEAPLGPNKIRTFNLAFFNADPKRTEPEFEMSIQLQDNGIAPSMVLDYGGYAVQGELAQVNALETGLLTRMKLDRRFRTRCGEEVRWIGIGRVCKIIDPNTN